MLTLAAADTIAGNYGGGGSSTITCTLFLMELNGTTEVYLKDQQQLGSSAATIYTVPTSTTAFIKSIHVVNTDTSLAGTFQLYAGGTAAANAITPLFTIPSGGAGIYEDGTGWEFFDANGQLQTAGAPASVITGGTLTSAVLTSDATANSTTTGVEVQQIAVGAAGTYIFEWTVLYDCAATTTGISLGINYTGTESVLCGWMEYPATGTSASTGAASMAASGATGQIHESFGFRAASTTAPNMGATVSVDATATNMCKVVGVLICSDTGDLELWHASEVAASSTIKTGTTVLLHRVN